MRLNCLICKQIVLNKIGLGFRTKKYDPYVVQTPRGDLNTRTLWQSNSNLKINKSNFVTPLVTSLRNL